MVESLAKTLFQTEKSLQVLSEQCSYLSKGYFARDSVMFSSQEEVTEWLLDTIKASKVPKLQLLEIKKSNIL